MSDVKICLFPKNTEVFSSHVAIGRKRCIDGSLKSESLDYSRRGKIYHGHKLFGYKLILYLARAEGFGEN